MGPKVSSATRQPNSVSTPKMRSPGLCGMAYSTILDPGRVILLVDKSAFRELSICGSVFGSDLGALDSPRRAAGVLVLSSQDPGLGVRASLGQDRCMRGGDPGRFAPSGTHPQPDLGSHVGSGAVTVRPG